MRIRSFFYSKEIRPKINIKQEQLPLFQILEEKTIFSLLFCFRIFFITYTLIPKVLLLLLFCFALQKRLFPEDQPMRIIFILTTSFSPVFLPCSWPTKISFLCSWRQGPLYPLSSPLRKGCIILQLAGLLLIIQPIKVSCAVEETKVHNYSSNI